MKHERDPSNIILLGIRESLKAIDRIRSIAFLFFRLYVERRPLV
jgi:hypothetical protein